MAGHYFKPVAIHGDGGFVSVEWDGNPNRTITCRIPTDAEGNILPEPNFARAIMEQCLNALEHWDRLEGKVLDVVVAKVGQPIDVTADYILRLTQPGVGLTQGLGPDAATPRQVRLAINQAGLRPTVEAWVAQQSQDVKDAWEYALYFQRTDPIILQAQAALGWTDQQMDDLFALARSFG